MFSNLTDFSFQRTLKQALGFYITYIIVIFILMFLVGISYVAVMVFGEGDYNKTIELGMRKWIRLSEIVFCIGFTVMVAINKAISGVSVFIYAVSACILTVFLSIFIGLIPAAYLTKKLQGVDYDIK